MMAERLQPMPRMSATRRNLKEVGGKHLVWRTKPDMRSGSENKCKSRKKTEVGYFRGMSAWHSFYKTREGWRLCVHSKSLFKLKAILKMLTSRSNGMRCERRKVCFIRSYADRCRTSNMQTWKRHWQPLINALSDGYICAYGKMKKNKTGKEFSTMLY